MPNKPSEAFPGSIWIGNVCFIRKDRKVLLLNRNKEPMKGKWTGVGGKTKFCEEPLESCVREVKEETGLDVKPKLAGIVTTINRQADSGWILFIYVADGFSGELRECDEGSLQWVEEERMYEKDLVGFIRVVLPHVMDRRRNSIFTGKTIHDVRGNVLSGIVRNEDRILLEIPG